jgi:hypothetical protein
MHQGRTAGFERLGEGMIESRNGVASDRAPVIARQRHGGEIGTERKLSSSRLRRSVGNILKRSSAGLWLNGAG